MMQNVREIEVFLRESLADAPGIVRVRGKGCLLGIEFADPCKDIHERLFDNKIITGTSSDPNVLRVLAPLCTRKEEIELFLEVVNG
jgi:acetylornithine/N-succinyldiaminopimelate aminotransferase